MAIVGIARARPDSAPMPVDAARENERWVILPGAEPLFSDMLASGQTLAGGCTFSNGQIERTFVVATYTCGGGQVVLQLLHPEMAPPGGVRTGRFAVTVKSGTPPDGFVEAIAERIRAREGAFEWKDLGRRPSHGMRWPVAVAAGVVAAVLLFWALRRRSRA